MNLPPLTTGAERLVQILRYYSLGINDRGNLGTLPSPVVWIELLLQYYPQAAVVFEEMTEFQRREAIDLLKNIRSESWQNIILSFFSVHELSHSTLINALSKEECDQLALKINYWDYNAVALLLRRTNGYLCSRICSHIWFGDYYRFFSHYLFALFSQIDCKEAFCSS